MTHITLDLKLEPGLYRPNRSSKILRSLHYPWRSDMFTRWIPLSREDTILLVDVSPRYCRWVADALEYKVLYGDKFCSLIQLIDPFNLPKEGVMTAKFLEHFEKVPVFSK